MEELTHIQDQLRNLQQHVTEQDAEMFRMSKRMDALLRRLEKMEGRMDAAQPESPLDVEPAADERPPHY